VFDRTEKARDRLDHRALFWVWFIPTASDITRMGGGAQCGWGACREGVGDLLGVGLAGDGVGLPLVVGGGVGSLEGGQDPEDGV
jgi:hypothetical protein